MIAERNPVNGSWTVYGLVRGYLMRRTYFGYSKREAVEEFRQESRSVG